MAFDPSSPGQFGLFVPTTNTWSLQQINDLEADENLKNLLIRLYQNINTISLALNQKDTGIYDTTEFIVGQQYFPNPLLTSQSAILPQYRQVSRKVINFGPLPNTATKSVPHNIDIQSNYTITRLYGASTNSNGTSMIPLPYASTTAVANNIELNIDTTNINIITGIDQTNYTTTYIVIEMIKQ